MDGRRFCCSCCCFCQTVSPALQVVARARVAELTLDFGRLIACVCARGMLRVRVAGRVCRVVSGFCLFVRFVSKGLVPGLPRMLLYETRTWDSW